MKKAVELSPRNETYWFNLANLYMVNHKVDDAIAIFRSLAGSTNPEVSMRSNQALTEALTIKQRSEHLEVRLENRTGQDTPARESADREESRGMASTVHTAPAPVHFLKGKLISVDCSTTPYALLTIAAGARSLKLHINDRAHVTLLGTDKFSCDWKGESVAVNYRERPDGDGDVVSVEIQ